MLNRTAEVCVTLCAIIGACIILLGIVWAIFEVVNKLGELRAKEIKCYNWFSKDFSELELGRHYTIQLDDGEDIWELKAKAVKQKRKEHWHYV